VVPHVEGALKEALDRMLGDPELHGHLKAGCAKVSLSLGWESPVRDMEKLYSASISGIDGKKDLDD